ncbi:MAG TPA: hypothetical protein VHX20_14810 [Terracidiphilus sp.]|nr:hypothetical protein [Terracidiphilus sp.]
MSKAARMDVTGRKLRIEIKEMEVIGTSFWKCQKPSYAGRVIASHEVVVS